MPSSTRKYLYKVVLQRCVLSPTFPGALSSWSKSLYLVSAQKTCVEFKLNRNQALARPESSLSRPRVNFCMKPIPGTASFLLLFKLVLHFRWFPFCLPLSTLQTLSCLNSSLDAFCPGVFSDPCRESHQPSPPPHLVSLLYNDFIEGLYCVIFM